MDSMAAQPVLNEACLTRILHYINESRARLCCRTWEQHLVKALYLTSRAQLAQKLHARGGALPYHHCTVRDFGGIEECFSYSFLFRLDRTYSLQWFREGLTSDNEQQFGSWHIEADALLCATLAPPTPPDPSELRYAEAGRVFKVPIDGVLTGTTHLDQQFWGWELAARGLTGDASVSIGLLHASHAATAGAAPATGIQHPQPPREDARFVEIDGDIHEVSRDIVENWPEHEWARLMRCRLRFGTGQERWA
jgi:hypothetical protein